MKKIISVILVIAFLLSTSISSAKENVVSFTYQDNTNKNWKGTYYDPWYTCSSSNQKGTFVAGSRDGAIAVSRNYKDWNIIDVTDQSIESIAFGKDKFVACGSNGTVFYSIDGFKWKRVSVGATCFLSKIVWNGSFFLIVGEDGLLLKSTDGIKWRRSTNKSLDNLYAMSWSGSMFLLSNYYVVTGKNENTLHSVLYRSQDGFNWTKIKDDSKYRYEEGIVSQGKFYMLGKNYLPKTYKDGAYIDNGYKSKVSIYNGKTIVDKELGNISIEGLCYANNKFFAFSYGGYGDYFSILVSKDCINWEKKPIDITTKHEKVRSALGTTLPKLSSLIYDGKKYSFVGNWGVIYTSEDGINWESVRPAISSILMDSIWDGNKFIVTSGDGSIRYSYDGLKWIYSKDVSTYALNSICYSGSKYIALSTYDYLGSSDGINWDCYPTELHSHLEKVVFDGKRFIVMGSSRKDGKAEISEIKDDHSLHQLSKDLLFNPRDFIWDGHKYIITSSNAIQYSTDCITWTTKKLKYNIEALSYGNGTYIAVGTTKPNQEKILKSNNGIDWTEVNPQNISLKECSDSYNSPTARWTGKEFIITNESSVYVSKDGSTWKDISPKKDKIDIEFKTCVANEKMYIIPGIHCILMKSK